MAEPTPDTCPHPDDQQTVVTRGRDAVQTCRACGRQTVVRP